MRLSVQASDFIARETAWRLVVEADQPRDQIRIYPELEGGLTATFPHQDYNSVGPDWRLGKPCLDRRSARYGRDAWHDEPPLLGDRLAWHLGRLLVWVDAAATNTLLQDGDPLELPPLPGNAQWPLLAFNEGLTGLNTDGRPAWGFATTAPVLGASRTRVLVDLHEVEGGMVAQARWNSAIDLTKSSADTAWIDLPSLPVMQPWEAPATWRALGNRLRDEDIDLSDVLASVGSAVRGRTKPGTLDRLVMSFPISDRVGGVPDRRHWLAITNLSLADKTHTVKGFRPTERNRRRFDTQLAGSSRPLAWARTASWASDSLRRRGRASERLRDKRVLLIGAGSLGSSVAELLVRMGVSKIHILDGDSLDAGNLSRHVLSMSSVGKAKAPALADWLNSLAPDTEASGARALFPPTSAEETRTVQDCDLILDCTGDDDVLRSLADVSWNGEKIFVSLGMTWGCQGFMAFAASESSFPVEDALSRFIGLQGPRLNIDDAAVDGIGCWSPVFPGTAEDVRLWASVAVGFIRDMVEQPRRTGVLFERGTDGAIKRTESE